MTQAHRIGDRYEVGELLGRGGMAEVRKGTDVRLGRTVAIKRLRTDLASDTTFQARFRREAQSAASLNNTRIVSVYDTGEETATDGSDVAQPYIVMEYVAGRTLREILNEGRKILPERALEITSQVLEALDYSHRAGIIHRDIKPGNVMLTPVGDVKVMDFGIARAVSDASSTMTQTAAVVGTAQYLSPEQARGETVDSRSDVYSTGCLLYELLTGRPPFVGDSPVAVAYQHVREVAPPPSSLDEDLTPQIDAIVMKALAKSVSDRYPSAAAMRADIERHLDGRPVQAPAVPVAPPADYPPAYPPGGPPTGSTPLVVTSTEEPAERKRRGPLALLIVLLLALIAAALVFGPRLFESGPQMVSVPTLTGLTRAEAEARIANAGLEVGTVSAAASQDVPSGQVVSQDPPDTEDLARGAEVDFVISNGKPQVRLPDVVGQGKNAAAAQLKAAGLRPVLMPRDTDDPRDQVITMQPSAGTSVDAGSKVTLFWSDGPEQVPSVVGRTQAQATELIEAAGFQTSVVTDPTRGEKGKVLNQSPEGGTRLDKGSTITIVVSDFVKPTPTPTPTPTLPTVPTPTPTPTAPVTP